MKSKEDKDKSIICEDCLKCADDKGYDQYMFHWVDLGVLRPYSGLLCNGCIERRGLVAKTPYTKKPKSKKR